MRRRVLKVVYILCSTYDDDGYPLRFRWGILPSNTLTCLSSLTRAVGESGELGDDVDVEVEIYDDTVQRIPIERVIRMGRRRDTTLVVGLVGVQTNQFARASDIAIQLREHDIPVMIGGFHVSGMLAMFEKPSNDLQRLLDKGVTLVKGEAEAPGALAGILRDALDGELKPIYNITEFPDLTHAVPPEPDLEYLKHFKCSHMGTLDTSRGCPFRCSFCTIINVQGRRLRSRSASAILKTIETNYAHGITMWFFTDDNFSRSPVWEDVFEGLADMRARGIDVTFMMQVDTRAYLIPGFVERAREAGCYMVFVGMESVNPANLDAMGKTQNDADDYPHMVECWRTAQILVHVGYIVGMPYDTPESIRKDVETLMSRVKVDEASFFLLTPLPGSEDHRRMVEAGTPMDADPNSFDSLHETCRHPRMAPGESLKAYHDAWETFYSPENIVDILLRTPRKHYWQMFWISMWYRYSTLEKSHPMFTGIMRERDRKARRPIFPRESIPRHAWRCIRDRVWMVKTYARLFFEFQEIWMLTRNLDDPRWATLADLRARWAALRQSIDDSNIRGRCDVAAQEVRATLISVVERLSQLVDTPKRLGWRARRGVKRQLEEARSFLSEFDVQMPSWQQVVRAEKYVHEGLVKRYEDLAIRYVAQRRRFNDYRHDCIRRIRTGRILTMDISMMPRLLAFEFMLGIRFLFCWFTQA